MRKRSLDTSSGKQGRAGQAGGEQKRAFSNHSQEFHRPQNGDLDSGGSRFGTGCGVGRGRGKLSPGLSFVRDEQAPGKARAGRAGSLCRDSRRGPESCLLLQVRQP